MLPASFELTRKQIKRGTHRSTKALRDAVAAYIDASNDARRPFVWSKTADAILDSVARFGTRISDSRHWQIARHGHEVASHGYAHRLIYDQALAAFREDVPRASWLVHCGRPVGRPPDRSRPRRDEFVGIDADNVVLIAER